MNSTPTPDLPIERIPHPSPLPTEERERIMASPGFGRHFTDHMVVIRWKRGAGWGTASLQPYQPFTLDPATSALHYGQAIFEGFKAYAQPDGSICTFRPDAHAQRLNLSAQRLAMPGLPPGAFTALTDALIQADRQWVPRGDEGALYLRPMMLATEVGLGVRPSSEYLFAVIASPAGAYFRGGAAPVNLWVCTDHVRAAPGGTGAAKCAGNYASSLVAQAEAEKHGCDQVLWLDATEHRFVEEMGGMNVFFVRRVGAAVTLFTPALDSGTILPGVTRASILELARHAGYQVEERRVALTELLEGIEVGTVSEAFACGTAATIVPIGTFTSSAGSWKIEPPGSNSVAATLRKQLLDIQFGRVADRWGWRHRVC